MSALTWHGDTLTPFGRNGMRLCSSSARPDRGRSCRAFLDQGEVRQANGRTILEYRIPAEVWPP